jgi:5,10-methylenetetrahydromethanopterin reductase
VTASRLAFGFLGAPSIPDMIDLSKSAEINGFDAIFVAETMLRRDAVTPIAAILTNTTHIMVGTAGINIYTRNAPLLAITWATLAEAGPGRTILGLCIGSASTLARQGVEVSHPIGRLREYTQAIRRLWSEDHVTYRGSYLHLDDASLEVRPQPMPPIFHCVGGPQALRLAARHADGVILDGFLPVERVGRMVQHVHDSAGGTFRGEIGASMMVSISDDWQSAADRIRPTIADYVRKFPEIAREMNLHTTLIDRLTSLPADTPAEKAGQLVPDDAVDALAVCGSAQDCAARIDLYRSSGVSLPVVFPEPSSLPLAVTLLAPPSAPAATATR